MAVRLGLRDHLRCDIAGGAAPVLDDHLLAPDLGQPIGNHATDRVAGAAGRKGHDESHVSAGEGRARARRVRAARAAVPAVRCRKALRASAIGTPSIGYEAATMPQYRAVAVSAARPLVPTPNETQSRQCGLRSGRARASAYKSCRPLARDQAVVGPRTPIIEHLRRCWRGRRAATRPRRRARIRSRRFIIRSPRRRGRAASAVPQGRAPWRS